MGDFFILLIAFFALELGYFRLADYFGIIDKPNERSSHTYITIRGGGIIFPIAWLVYSLMNGFVFPWVTIGLMAIAAVSFADDRMALSNRFRFAIHLVAFTLCFIQLNLFDVLPWRLITIVYIVGIGCVNAVNFMDGINGITGLYSLSVFVPAQWFLYHEWWNGSIINYLILSVLVFGCFNFRKKARCFAGDVGSVSMGYILVFFLLGFIFNRFETTSATPLLTISSNLTYQLHIQYIMLLTLYGIDAIGTLVQRLYLKENIFEAHRRHFYQILCNEYRLPHVVISASYAIVQILINWYVLQFAIEPRWVFWILLGITLFYALSKFWLIKNAPNK